jgi:acyl carrier protein
LIASPDDFDFRAQGVIDSLGFVRMLNELERRLECPIDLSELAPQKLTNFGVLVSYIAAQLAAHDVIATNTGI